ncbi:MAG: hypothetical protein U9N87_02110, partial [Planctomycetota bacterium]|nr:hypothetical protein [Planctomycetota bacterium]
LSCLDRHHRRAVWRAPGRRPALDEILAGTPDADRSGVEIPKPRPLDKRFPGGVPQGRFEEANSDFWHLMPCWANELGSAASVNPSFESSAARKHPYGWKAPKTDNPKLRAVYDWKVMHDHSESGRTFHGRSSVMLAAEPGAGDAAARTIAWEADIDVPEGPLQKQIIRVRAHGEGLAGIAEAGMAVRLLDAQGKPQDTIISSCPARGTFVWRPLELPCTFDKNIKKLQVRLYLTAAKNAKNAGRLWFDSFEIVPATAVDQADLQVILTDGGCLQLKARPGIDLACVPFRVDSKKMSGALRFKLRADRSTKVTAKWHGGKNVEKTVKVGKQWTSFEIPLSLDKAVGAARVIFRPQAAATLWIDDVELR